MVSWFSVILVVANSLLLTSSAFHSLDLLISPTSIFWLWLSRNCLCKKDPTCANVQNTLPIYSKCNSSELPRNEKSPSFHFNELLRLLGSILCDVTGNLQSLKIVLFYIFCNLRVLEIKLLFFVIVIVIVIVI